MRAAGCRGERQARGRFAFELEPGGGGPLVTVFVDALARELDGTLLIVDYKTDRLADEAPAALIGRAYETQRMVYALAALRGGARGSTSRTACSSVRPSRHGELRRGERRGARERAARACGGVLDEQWPVAARPQRELCGAARPRRAVLAWPEAMTLRPAAAAYESPGSLAGSDGPS